MEAHAGRHIDIEVGVMHAVQPPQHRDMVKNKMLRVDRQIQNQEAENGREPGAERLRD